MLDEWTITSKPGVLPVLGAVCPRQEPDSWSRVGC